VRITKTIEEVREAVAGARGAGKPIVLVPTMGFLHDGHLSLVRHGRARALEAGGADAPGACVVMSIFVNPTQFGPGEDFGEYPRDLDRDAALAREHGVDLLFAPAVREMYPEGFRTEVRVTELTEPMCGAGRPGHFDGVALVVTKLLNIVRPDWSVFGRKDAQQALVIRRLAADLDLPGRILVAPTVRDDDGVALSSRNAYLSAEEREAARALSRGLRAAARAWDGGERSREALLALVNAEIDREPLVRPEYVDLRSRDTLRDWNGEGPALLAVAARVGRTRLIDNVFLGGEEEQAGPVDRPGRTSGSA